jgi:hypothetical protein
MLVDLVCLALLVGLTWRGFKMGIVAQLARLAALLLIFWGTPPLSAVLTRALYGVDELEPRFFRLGMTLISASILYVGAMILSHVLLQGRDKDDQSSKDKLGGAILGSLKAMAIVYLVLDGAIYLHPWLERFDAEDQLHIRDSRLASATGGLHGAMPWIEPLTDAEPVKTRLKENF